MRAVDGFVFILKDFWGVTKSVLPLLIALLVAKAALKSPVSSVRGMIAGGVFLLVGLFLFQKGIGMCLEPLAKDTGESLVRAEGGRAVIFAVCCAVSCCAVFAEPALKVLGGQIEELTVGSVRSSLLVAATAVGASLGTGLGVARVLYNLPTSYVMIPILAVLLVLGFVVKDFYFGVAFDCAAAITGPVSIPINALIVAGLATSIAGIDPINVAFGLVGLTTLGAAMAVMIVSLL